MRCLYACTGCGFVSTRNFRGLACPVCGAVMAVNQLHFIQLVDGRVEIKESPAPLTNG